MASIDASFNAAIVGLQKGVEQANKVAAQIADQSAKAEGPTSSASDSEDGKGGSIDVTV